jgi:hypothetical protein
MSRKFIIAAALFSSVLSAQSTATIQFSGEVNTVSQTLTVNTNGFTPEINGLESLLAPGCYQPGGAPIYTLTAAVTSVSTSYTISNAACVQPGMGIAIGCAGSGGNCSIVAIVKAAGCAGNVCPVVQGQLGTTAGSYAIGTPVTIIQYGNGESAVCGTALISLKQFAQLGAATASVPVSSTTSTAIATQNSVISAALASIASIISGAFTCTPSQ